MDDNDKKIYKETQIVEPVIQETEQVAQQTKRVHEHTEKLSAKTIVATLFGLVELLIGLRFALKLLGANPNSGFVKFMNGLTGFFVNLFSGIFAEKSFGGGSAVFEPASIVAMIVVAIIAWVVLKLMAHSSNKHIDETSFTSGTRLEK